MQRNNLSSVHNNTRPQHFYFYTCLLVVLSFFSLFLFTISRLLRHKFLLFLLQLTLSSLNHNSTNDWSKWLKPFPKRRLSVMSYPIPSTALVKNKLMATLALNSPHGAGRNRKRTKMKLWLWRPPIHSLLRRVLWIPNCPLLAWPKLSELSRRQRLGRHGFNSSPFCGYFVFGS